MRDQTGKGLAFAKVKVIGGGERRVTSDSAGRFSMDVPGGRWTFQPEDFPGVSQETIVPADSDVVLVVIFPEKDYTTSTDDLTVLQPENGQVYIADQGLRSQCAIPTFRWVKHLFAESYVASVIEVQPSGARQQLGGTSAFASQDTVSAGRCLYPGTYFAKVCAYRSIALLLGCGERQFTVVEG